jgi:hypothetical protein
MDFDALFPGRFLKAGLLKGQDWTLTIRSVYLEHMEKDDGGTEQKGIISLAETPREWVANKTNCTAIMQMFGRDTEGWVGKRVTIYPTTFKGEPCIRVRGSPDIPGPVEFDFKLPKKKATRIKLLKTPEKGTAPKPEPEPPQA